MIPSVRRFLGGYARRSPGRPSVPTFRIVSLNAIASSGSRRGSRTAATVRDPRGRHASVAIGKRRSDIERDLADVARGVSSSASGDIPHGYAERRRLAGIEAPVCGGDGLIHLEGAIRTAGDPPCSDRGAARLVELGLQAGRGARWISVVAGAGVQRPHGVVGDLDE